MWRSAVFVGVCGVGFVYTVIIMLPERGFELNITLLNQCCVFIVYYLITFFKILYTLLHTTLKYIKNISKKDCDVYISDETFQNCFYLNDTF